jgi:hypothetical protein
LIIVGLVAPNKKRATYYSKPMLKIGLMHLFPITDEDTLIDFPKPQPIQERENNKIIGEESREPSPKVITKNNLSTSVNWCTLLTYHHNHSISFTC